MGHGKRHDNRVEPYGRGLSPPATYAKDAEGDKPLPYARDTCFHRYDYGASGFAVRLPLPTAFCKSHQPSERKTPRIRRGMRGFLLRRVPGVGPRRRLATSVIVG